MKPNKRDCRMLGITGNVGCGKSTVLRYLEERWHARVLELDRVAAQLQRKGGSCYQPMIDILGSGILGEDGELDRRKTADRMFADPALVRKVNEAVHPRVEEFVRGVRAALSEEAGEGAAPLLVIESALLYEGRCDRICDEIWYIYAPARVRWARLRSSRGYSEEKCRAVSAAQKDDAFFRERADVMIDNGADDPAAAFAQVDREMERLMGRN